ncbi:hypothetical protein Tco_0651106 [Tanacetum coccineum]
MANLELCDKHNMVAYLKKPSGSEGFQEIVDFLNGSHIRYALTKNPTIYVSLIKKFWQTATVRTVDNGEQEITAIVDGKEFTVNEASVRRHLQLADVDESSNVCPLKMLRSATIKRMTKDVRQYQGLSDDHSQLLGAAYTLFRCHVSGPLHSPLHQQAATVRTIDNEEREIIATVDGKEFIVTEASVRRHLQLAYVDGISVLPTTKIFDQLLLMGNKRFLNPHNRKYITPNLTPKLFSNMKRGFSREHTPLFPSMLAIQAEEGEGSGHPSEPQPPHSTAQPTIEEPIPNVVSSSHQMKQTPRQALNKVTKLPQTSKPIPNVPDEAVYEEWDDIVEKATTTAASLDADQASH